MIQVQRAKPKPYHSPWLIRRPDPVDWFRLLADLQGFGWSNADVARALNVQQQTLARWKEGSEPGYTYGRMLVELHAQVCISKIRNSETAAKG